MMDPVGKFVPPAGARLLFIGQDCETIAGYCAAMGPEHAPGGVTSYASLDRLWGLSAPVDYGSGTMHLSELAKLHPTSVISLGLYLVDFLPRIVSGAADANIDTLVDFLIETQRPVLLRFGYEFDGKWNRYEPADYVAAWKHFKARLETKGATNIALVWQSASYCGGRYGRHPLESWYPGDEFVDWVALSYFTQPEDCAGGSLEEILSFARRRGKPVMIAESAPKNYATEGLSYSRDGSLFHPRSPLQIWEEWYKPFFAFVHDNADVVKAVAYINTFWDSQPKYSKPYKHSYWGDSRVQANADIFATWRHEVSQGGWLHGGDRLFASLGWKLRVGG